MHRCSQPSSFLSWSLTTLPSVHLFSFLFFKKVSFQFELQSNQHLHYFLQKKKQCVGSKTEVQTKKLLVLLCTWRYRNQPGYGKGTLKYIKFMSYSIWSECIGTPKYKLTRHWCHLINTPNTDATTFTTMRYISQIHIL
jgi:hypothetical protein